jgi:hypothetical protein
MDGRQTALGALVLGALAVGVAGCGSGSGGSTSQAAPATTATTTGSAPSPVSVLGSSVRADGQSVAVSLRLRQPADADPPVARTAQLDLAGVGPWRGGALPSCAAATVKARGADGCPRGSILGQGQATGKADTSTTVGAITIINGGGDRILLATTVRNPAYAKSVSAGTVVRKGDGVRISVAFAKDLQVIAGVPVGLQELQLTLDRRAVLGTRSCPAAGGWRYASQVAFEDGTHVARSGAVACTDR